MITSLNLLIKVSAELGGDHYRKWSNKERNWRGVGWCSHVWRRVPLLFSIGLFRKEIRAPLLGPFLHLWHLMNVPHLFNITCNLVGRRMDRGCGVLCGHLDLPVAASSSAESRKPAWCCPSACLGCPTRMLSHVFTSLAAKSTFLPATSVRVQVSCKEVVIRLNEPFCLMDPRVISVLPCLSGSSLPWTLELNRWIT